MSKSFAFAANAEPFVPDPLCEEKMKMKLESRILTLEAQLEEERLSKMRLIKSYQSEKAQVNSFSEKNFKDLEKENERLNKHIRDGATKLLYERDKVRERDTLIIQQKEKITSFSCRIAQLECDNSNWYRKYEELEMTYETMKKEVNIKKNDDVIDLYKKLSKITAECLDKTIKMLISGKINYQNQNNSVATYAHKLNKNEGIITWNLSAVQIHNKMRAFKYFPGTFFYHNQNLSEIF